MKKFKLLFYLISISILTTQHSGAQIEKNFLSKKKELTEEQLRNWHLLDYQQDTIPGISINKAYEKLLKNQEGKEVVVAVLDTKFDIYQEDLKDQIWVNTKEIPDNGIDDDKNGYVDDVNGWDFISNSNGEHLKYQNRETIRILRYYDSIFKNDTMFKYSEAYKLYKRAEEVYDNELAKAQKRKIKQDYWYYMYPKSQAVLKLLFKEKEYTKEQIDSLYKLYKDNTYVASDIQYMQYFMEYNKTVEGIKQDFDKRSDELNIKYNKNHDDRQLIGDDANNLNDRQYGSNKVYGNVPLQHATRVAGVAFASRRNNIGINGITDQVKIMPVVMVANGDEHDKDVALAIRYAVDNGAKIINMSFGKLEFSLHPEWVLDALKYAEKHDVLVINLAGNENTNIDITKHYPTDMIDNIEIVSNFIKVGAINYKIEKGLKTSFSNYGKKNVDIFAPGEYIYTTEINNTYDYSKGTSFAAPIVAGVAALIRSYYPELSAKQIKQIILNSGTDYITNVDLKLDNGDTKSVKFSELSKSGKVVNAYHALLMAEKVSSQRD